MAVSFIGGGHRSTRRKTPTCRKSRLCWQTLIEQVVVNPTTTRSRPRLGLIFFFRFLFLFCFILGVTVHKVIPLAFEYQAKNTLKRADNFLSDEILDTGDNLTSKELVKKILEAEKYNLMNYLKSCVMTAAKRRFKSLLACKDFYRITEKTKLEIRFKRWKDVEIVSDLEARLTQNSGSLILPPITRWKNSSWYCLLTSYTLVS